MSSIFFKLFTGFCLLVYQSSVFSNAPLDRIVAVVNEDVIMQSELENKMDTVKTQVQQQGATIPPLSIFQQQVLEKLVSSRVQLQLAARIGIRVDDETLNNTINTIAAGNNVSLSQFKQILEQDGYSYESFREDIRNEVTLNQLRKRQIESRIVITEKEIDNYLANQKLQGDLQTEIRLSHILIALPELASEAKIAEVRQTAIKVREDLLSGADFAKTASTISDSGSANTGGDLGWRKSTEIPSLFVEYIPKMKKGDISEVIESSNGFHIIKIVDIQSITENIIDQTLARHILIKPDQLVSSSQAKAKLEQLLLRINNGDNFAALAKGNSQDTVSAIEGGVLGWRSPGELVPEFQRAMDALEIDEISEPFQSSFGWHIVQVLDRRRFDNTESIKRGKARMAIRERKLKEALLNWTRQLLDEAYVEYRLDDS